METIFKKKVSKGFANVTKKQKIKANRVRFYFCLAFLI